MAEGWFFGDAPAGGTPINDTFNRANSTTGLGTTSDGAATWANVDGVAGISTNQAYLVTSGSVTGLAIACIDPGLSDGSVQMTVTGGGSSSCGVSFRWVDSTHWWYYLANPTTPSNSGLFSTLGQQLTISNSDGDIVKVSFVGTQIDVYVNGVLAGSKSSAFAQAGTKHGVAMGFTPARGDNFVWTPAVGQVEAWG